jgi:hypothetical protein
MYILLKSNPLKVMKILKPSKARMFENVEIGDILQISVPIESVGSTTTGGSKTVDLEVLNLSKLPERTYKTMNQLPKILENFILEEIR